MKTIDLPKGYCTSILGIPMKEDKARKLEEILKSEAKADDYTKVHNPLPPTQRNPAERSDVSWITVEEPDNAGDLVITKSLDLSLFNNLVTIEHKYEGGGVGRSLWQKPYSDAGQEGIIAKSQYPKKPAYLTDKDQWAPDKIWALIESGLLSGKSAGMVPKRNGLREPTQEELDRFPDRTIKRVIDGAYLVEYAVCSKPVQPKAYVTEILKAVPDMPKEVLDLLGLPEVPKEEIVTKSEETTHHFGLSLEDILRDVERRLSNFDIAQRIHQRVQDAIARSQGRV